MKIYNSLKRTKEDFVPMKSGEILMYVCGLTVYDNAHLGHARCYISFDIIVRFFKHLGYKVKYIRNITDIDDKIINRANELNIPWDQIVTKYIKNMHEDFKALGMLEPDAEPRATENIPEIIKMIDTLIENKFAYVTPNSDVYFEVSKFKNYGSLSKKDLSGQEIGKRVSKSKDKHGNYDFALWKNAKPNEPSWESPWGKGRPGWHIECSAMSVKMLGKQFDIHGGGLDLQFPHHENEIAQSECCFGQQFVNYWMHAGYLNINKEKMSKSTGNFMTIRNTLKKYNPENLRFCIISSHYRSSINYSEELLESSFQSLKRLYNALRNLKIVDIAKNTQYEKDFIHEMSNDFNTPNAISILFSVAHEIQKIRDTNPKKSASLAGLLHMLGGVLGILQQEPDVFLQENLIGLDIDYIESLIVKRNIARKEKKWDIADKMRDELKSIGIELEDKSGNTIWTKK